MAARAGSDAPVVVVGGGVAGMAAAARLAKSGHPVELVEASDRLGGAWAPYPLGELLVDAAPSVLGFPAPWRDLFRKSGRPLEAELARTGTALAPAPGARYLFADGTDLTLPTDRGEQYEVLADHYGSAVAARWRDLVDGLDLVWQAVRPLGLESELRDRRQLQPVRKVLRPRRTLAQVARDLDEPHLAALVASIAYRLGSAPELTPGWCAVELSVQRTFGRWAIDSEVGADVRGRTSVLVEALAGRLQLRKVTVRLGRRVTGLTMSEERISGVRTADGDLAASAVVCTVDPWQTTSELWPVPPSRRQRSAARGWRPALAPAVSHQVVPEPQGTVTETVALSQDGVPTVTYRRPVTGGTLQTVHDYANGSPRSSAGIAWNGFRSWLDRPAVTTEMPGLFLAGPFSPGGSSPSSVVLSGALASYACHDYLG
jgi:phytoene dehydrogenase-like protein